MVTLHVSIPTPVRARILHLTARAKVPVHEMVTALLVAGLARAALVK